MFDSLLDSYSKFLEYSIRYSIRMKLQMVGPILIAHVLRQLNAAKRGHAQHRLWPLNVTFLSTDSAYGICADQAGTSAFILVACKCYTLPRQALTVMAYNVAALLNMQTITSSI